MQDKQESPDKDKAKEQAKELLDKTVNRPEKQFARPGHDKRG